MKEPPDQQKGRIVSWQALPVEFPTHRHEPEFWERLGRTIATFGLLEEVLGKAIFALSGTREYGKDEIDEAYAKWLPTLEKALSDPLGRLIDGFEKSLRSHSKATPLNSDDLVHDLYSAAQLRNVLCHGSWRSPNNLGGSIPLFVTPKMEIFDTPIDIPYLRQTQSHVVELICEVMNIVTQMGWSFPGSAGRGEVIF